MRTLLLCAVVLAPPWSAARADESPEPRRPVHTYSIVARDAATGQLGVAVQSHWVSVGSGVLWAEASAGRVAESLPLFEQAFEMWPRWRELVLRLPASGLLPDDEGLIERIVSVP